MSTVGLSSTRWQAGQTAIADLEKRRSGAYYDVLSTWSASQSSKEAAVYFFGTTVPKSLDSLRRRLNELTDMGWDRWVSDAADLSKSMNDVAGYKGEWSMLGVLRDTAAATAAELGTAAQGAVKGAGVGAGIVTFLVLGYVAFKVLRVLR